MSILPGQGICMHPWAHPERQNVHGISKMGDTLNVFGFPYKEIWVRITVLKLSSDEASRTRKDGGAVF